MTSKHCFESLHRVCMILLATVLSAVVSLPATAQAAWDGTIATAFAGGDGTEANPYQIANGAQLAHLAQMCNGQESGGWSAGKHFVLTADIVLNSGVLTDGELTEDGEFNAWTPIGIYDAAHSREFQGTFDGNGHTVSGLYINPDDSENIMNVGLFGGAYNAVIKNVTIADAYVHCLEHGAAFVGHTTTSTFTGITVTARVNTTNGSAACVSSEDSGSTFEGCTSNGYVDAAKEYVGGIVAVAANATLSTCTNNAEVYCSATASNVHSICGGMAGQFKGTATGCVNNGFVHASTNQEGIEYYTRGGIIGYVNDASTITGCANNGSVEGTNCTGGIIGSTASNKAITIDDCLNNGSVTGKKYVGGITGYYYGNKEISNCRNNATGIITVNSGGEKAGGIVGYHRDYGSGVSSCFNYAPIVAVAAASHVGGIAGYSYKGIKNCENHGEVKTNTENAALNCVGGIVGYPNTCTVSACKNHGNVNGNEHVGGIIGEGYNCSTNGNTNFAQVTATGTRSGGIGGYLHNYGTHQNNVNYGRIQSSSTVVGGVAGQVNYYYTSSTYNFTNNWNEGDVSGTSVVGGVIGFFYMDDDGSLKVNINYCHNQGSVTGTEGAVGGLIGDIVIYRGTSTTIANCYNAGDVTGTTSVGGLVGRRRNTKSYTYYTYVRNCYNLGSVCGTDYVGGLLGQNSYGSYGDVRINFYNCYSAAPSITATEGSNVGKLAGLLMAGATMKNCYGLALTNSSITLYETDNPTALADNLTFGDDFAFTNNTVTIGETVCDNLFDALNVWAAANNYSQWRTHAGINSDYPYPTVLACETPVITQDAANNYVITTATADAEIRYTVDRTYPTAASALYESPFTTGDNNYIKAFAQKPGMFDSELAEFDCYTSVFTLGDVNNDGHVYATDIVTTVNHILGNAPAPFIFRAADINTDNAVTVEDVTLIAQIILGTYNAPSRIKARDNGDAALGVSAMDGNLNVAMSSSEGVQAYQMDITLPQGVTVTGVKLSDRATATHSLGWRVMDNGVLRVIAYSIMGDLLRGNDGTLFSISYTTDNTLADDNTVCLDGIRLVKADGTAILPAALSLNVDNIATGIVQCVEASSNSPLYNLQGQKVNGSYKGIVVTRGRKAVVK